jgi:hypothetical protein
MAFRYDMQGKTLQQQIIVSKRDEEDKRRRQETENFPVTVNSPTIASAIDREKSPSPRMDFRDFLHSIKS